MLLLYFCLFFFCLVCIIAHNFEMNPTKQQNLFHVFHKNQKKKKIKPKLILLPNSCVFIFWIELNIQPSKGLVVTYSKLNDWLIDWIFFYFFFFLLTMSKHLFVWFFLFFLLKFKTKKKIVRVKKLTDLETLLKSL